MDIEMFKKLNRKVFFGLLKLDFSFFIGQRSKEQRERIST